MVELTLYELAGADPALRFSPHCWKTRMTLVHKGLEANRVPCRFPDRPTLFGVVSAVFLTGFINRWADVSLLPAIAHIILLDVYNQLAPVDRPYFRHTREQRFGQRLEDVVANQTAHVASLREMLAPLRHTLAAQPFLAGKAAAYADYCVFGMFMWARCVSTVELPDRDDPVYAWRDRL